MSIPNKQDQLEEKTNVNNLETIQEGKQNKLKTTINEIHGENTIKLDINSPAMNKICKEILAQKEKVHLEKIKLIFETSWKEISLGEQFMADYIHFCKTKMELPPDIFLFCARQIRYIFVCVRISYVTTNISENGF